MTKWQWGVVIALCKLVFALTRRLNMDMNTPIIKSNMALIEEAISRENND